MVPSRTARDSTHDPMLAQRSRPAPDVRLFPLALMLLAGLAVLLLVLVAGGQLSPIWALAAGACGAAAASGAVWLTLTDLRAIEAEAAAVAAGLTEPAASGVDTASTAAGRRARHAVQRLQRAWRRRHERLSEEHEALQSIFEALHDPLLIVGAERRVVRANTAARDLFGDKVAERDLAASLRNPAVLDAVDAVLGGAASRSVEFTIPVPVEMTFEARIKPFRAATDTEAEERGEGTPAVILTLHEITAIKRSEQMRADFVANASHELRTPLSALLGFIETLRGPARDDPEAQDRFLSIMSEQATRMSRLVQDLLSLSRIELDERTPPQGRADVAQLAQTAVSALELRARDRGVRLSVEVATPTVEVIGDPDQLVQVFQNLLDNAIKYTREKTEVTVHVTSVDSLPVGSAAAAAVVPLQSRGRKGNRMVAVAVVDRGDGIARAHLPRLTERFYRVDPARSRQLGGTGLGLAIVKHIVNRHRGRLTIESEVGKGSTFTVYLPAAVTAEDKPVLTPAALDAAGPTAA